MKYSRVVPEPTVRRLAIYYRFLSNLFANGYTNITSSELGEKLGIPPTQIRKDLSYFGEFGRKGVGYNVSELISSLGKILGINQNRKAVLVGAGNLGRALVNYQNFKKIGLQITNVFDNDLFVIGNYIGSIRVQSMKELAKTVQQEEIKIGIITVSPNAAQQVTNQLIKAGIEAIWNFTTLKLQVPDHILVHDEDLSTGISTLIHYFSFSSNS